MPRRPHAHVARAVAACLVLLAPAAGALAQTVTRGPYLQLGTDSSVTVRWRTNTATDSEVRYGPAPDTLTQSASDPSSTTEHVVTVSGLAPSTLYYYSIGTSTQTLAGGDPDHFFATSPPAGVAEATRVWVLGDSGTANQNARDVRDAYLAFTATAHTSIWLMLGDNAYPDGTDNQYQSAVFNTYPSVLRSSVLWPTLGNHDGHTADSATQSGPYYDIFTLPTAAQAGGLASGTEAYYSFDRGNIHFICLESYETDRSTSGPMLTWLEQDLLATTQDWIVAFYHHPPYTKGSHDSDNEIEHIEMRQNATPILEAGGVDLVLGGHSHAYERSLLIDGHYGSSGTFNPSTMLVDGGDGRTDGDGAYAKSALGPVPREGAVYIVAGSSGQVSGGALNHPVMYLSLNVLGSLVVDVDGGRMDVRFVDSTSAVRDYFTVVKGTGAGTPPAAPTGLAATGGPGLVDLDWDDNLEFDVTSYAVYRSETGGGPYGLIATGLGSSGYTDTSVVDGTTYFYVVTALDADGLESPMSSEAAATPEADTTPPAAPVNLVASGADAVVDLDWDDNTEPDLDTYAVYRSQTSGGPYSLIASGLLTSDYADGAVTNDETYFYVVTASDTSGNESATSAEASATPTSIVDDAASSEVLVAGTVSGSFADTGAADGVYESIQERQSGGKPSSRYTYLEHKWLVDVTGGSAVTLFLKAYKSVSQDADAFVFSFSTDDASYTDMFTLTRTVDDGTYQTFSLPAGTSGTVWIRVVDTEQTPGGLFEDTVFVDHLFVRSQTSTDTDPPAAPTGLVAVPINPGRIDLDWDDNVEPDLLHYDVHRSSAPGGPYTTIASGVASSDFSDSGLSAATTYYYVVTAIDVSLNASPDSSEASATTPAGCAPSATHVDAIVTALEPVGNGNKERGRVEVTVLSDCGDPVSGATVVGTFSGGLSSTASGITDASGVAVLQSGPDRNVGSYTFCVDSITHATLSYDDGANVVTCGVYP